ncbi:hypothetical protein FCR2A7T_22930 [Flavobacterium cauense R2A-7]|nr:hypothetical protein FCR2A7T_22930 [Flavobacterium cauense R2A-7]
MKNTNFRGQKSVCDTKKYANDFGPKIDTAIKICWKIK